MTHEEDSAPLPTQLERLREELQLEERRLTHAMRQLDEAMERVRKARMSYTIAFNEFMTAQMDRRKS
jgi:hypothetical protein